MIIINMGAGKAPLARPKRNRGKYPDICNIIGFVWTLKNV